MKAPVTIICSRLDLPGGLERATVSTANLLQEKGHAVTVVSTEKFAESFYPLHALINVFLLELDFGISEKGNKLTKKIRLVKHINELSKLLKKLQPAVVIGTEYALTIAAYYASNRATTAVIGWEHHHFHWLSKNRFWRFLHKMVYPNLARVICLNAAEQQYYTDYGCKTVVIPNFVKPKQKASLTTKIILSVGWLIKRKGVDQLPEIAQNVFAKYPDWRWHIIGSGEEYETLKNEIENRSLAAHVFILEPTSSNLEDVYEKAALFVLLSRFECFPMVLLEAQAHGLPTVSYDCPTGPSFIINNNKDGLLIEPMNTADMSNAICSLIADEEKRKAMGDAAYQNVIRFLPDAIYPLWEDLLQSLVKNN